MPPHVRRGGTRGRSNTPRHPAQARAGLCAPRTQGKFAAFDEFCKRLLWMKRTHPDLPWCRYADDGLVHCRTEQEAEALKAELRARLAECHLELHPTKTKIVYCRDGKRKGTYPNVKFDFLGYCYRPRWIKKSRDNSMFCGFNPAVSPSALKTMRSTIRDLNIRRQTQLSLADIARTLNPLVRGW